MTLNDVVVHGHPDLPVEDSPPPSRGMLAHSDHGVSTCMRCNWRGVPTFVLNTETMRPEPSHECPVCDRGEPARPLLRPVEARSKVARNAPCPCGSGVKAKKCCHA